MAKHNIYLRIPKMEVFNSDVSFQIHRDDEKLGEITISKGTLDYYPKNRKKNPISIYWKTFDTLLRMYEAGEIKI